MTAPTETPPVEEAPEAPDEQNAGGNVDELPAWARDALQKANREAASYRTKVRELEPLAQKANAYEESQKTEAEKAAERIAAAEKAAADSTATALRLEVALDKGLEAGLTRDQVRTLQKRLVGSTREELEADADELLASFASAPKSPGTRRPKEALRGGADPEEDPAPDPEKTADTIRRRF